MNAPYYEDDFVRLFHGDCRVVTEWQVADVLCTDPPYGRSWRQGRIAGRGSGRTKGDLSLAHGGIAGDSDTAARDEMLALWSGGRVAAVFGDLMLAPPLGNRQTCVYRKAVGAGVRGATGGRRRDIEAIYLVGPWPSGIGGASSVFETHQPQHTGQYGLAARYGHPHAKPLDVMQDLVDMCPPGVVADPFAGSGSTLVAAKLLGRRAVGVEIEEHYCEIAARRLAQDVLPSGEAS